MVHMIQVDLFPVVFGKDLPSRRELKHDTMRTSQPGIDAETASIRFQS